MKIGILTLPLNGNGGALQGIALYNFFKQQGLEPYLIDWQYYKKWQKTLMNIIETLPIVDFKNISYRKRIMRKFNQMVNSEIGNKTHAFYTTNQLKEGIKKYEFDAIVVGSDQVWRVEYTKSGYKNFFLDFVDSKESKKISYAASFGVGEWSHPSLVKEITVLLSEFHAVSVRENSGVKLCNDVFNISNATHVLDPTFLISIDFYNSIADRYIAIDSKANYVFSYILDITDYKKQTLESVKKELSLDEEPIHIESDIRRYKKIKNYSYPSIAEWLYKIKNSSYVITDSFHGTVFAIIFNKPFISIINKQRGADRFVSLLTELGLDNRMVEVGDVIPMNLMKDQIDYTKVNSILKDRREFSENFLLKALS